jgi:hypothetical protein
MDSPSLIAEVGIIGPKWREIKNRSNTQNVQYIYPTCIDPSNTTKKYMFKPFQNHAKCLQGIPLHGNEVSDAFNHTQMGVFMKNMRKCTKEISHDLGCRSAVC